MPDSIPPHTPISEGDRRRVVVVCLGLFFLFSLLIIQYYDVQVLQWDKWNRIANRQHFFTMKEPFKRGTFYSNTSVKQGHPQEPIALVIDIQTFHLHVDPVSIPPDQRDEMGKQLQSLLHLDAEPAQKLRAQLDKCCRRRTLASWVDIEAKEAVMHWWLPFAKVHKIPRNALYFEADYRRSYPFGKLLGSVLHTVQGRKDEVTGQAIPTGGLELQFNKVLQGHPGSKKMMRSPRHAFEIGEIVHPPDNGADVHLTINHVLQAIAEEELARGVQKAKAKCGWAAMMDPHTGAILALAQYPFFYPEHCAEYFNDAEKIDCTRVKPLLDAIEPGSIMKPITAAIALKANEVLAERGEPPIFLPEEKMATADGQFPGRKPLKDFRVYKHLNLDMALQVSSNIYFARLTQRIVDRLGAAWYRQQLKECFGFGQPSGLELPAENPGLLPTPGKKHPNGTLEWSKPTPFSMAIGHNIQANTIQMLRAFSVLANGGHLVQPTLVQKITKVTPQGQTETLIDHTSYDRLNSFPQVVDSDMIARVVKGLKYVTKGKRSDIPGYTQVGKTGTAEKIVNGVYSKERNVSSFIGFAPVDEPLFVLMVSIDEPEQKFAPGIGPLHYGGYCAAPVFREIGRRTLEYLGIAPDDPFGYPKGDPRHDPLKAKWAQESKALKELMDTWNR